jgi:hypothetical protein
VSNTATCGSSRGTRRATSMPVTLTGLCSGASADSSRMAASTPSSISTGAENRAPPWTTRCATAVRPSSAVAAPRGRRREDGRQRRCVVGQRALEDLFGAVRAAMGQAPGGLADALGQARRERLPAVDVDHPVLQRRGPAVEDEHPARHGATRFWAWIAVIATVLTMSCTVAPRERSLTGLRRPCRTGPTATRPRCAAPPCRCCCRC